MSNVIPFPTPASDIARQSEPTSDMSDVRSDERDNVEQEDSAARLSLVRANNHSALQDLQTRGMTIQHTDILTMRLELLYDAILGPEDHSPRRRELELIFEGQIAEALKGALTQVFAAQLTAPAGTKQTRSGLVLP